MSQPDDVQPAENEAAETRSAQTQADAAQRGVNADGVGGFDSIEDEQLPEDLQPGDNPLAGGLDAGETVDDLMTGGKHADGDAGAEGGPAPRP